MLPLDSQPLELSSIPRKSERRSPAEPELRPAFSVPQRKEANDAPATAVATPAAPAVPDTNAVTPVAAPQLFRATLPPSDHRPGPVTTKVESLPPGQVEVHPDWQAAPQERRGVGLAESGSEDVAF